MQQVGHSSRRRTGTALTLWAVLGLVLASCGGEPATNGPAPSAQSNATRPEGSWTLIRWLVRRSDTATGRGQAVERRLALTPSCAAGPCDIAVGPDGVGGTYLPEGYTASASARPPQPYTLSWKSATGTYEFVDPPAKVSCTTAEGQVVPDGYELTTTTSVTFAPGPPATLRGTYTEKVTGIAAKCTDYQATWTIAAAPTSTAVDDRVDLSGTYVVTEIVEAVVPAGSRPPGFAGILVPSATIAKTASGYAVSGTAAKPTDLVAAATGWGGEASAPGACEPGGRTVAGGYDQTERWSRLRPVVSAEDGRPVVVGLWQTQWTPTSAGTAAGCPATSNKGYVLFVPTSAVPTT
jgi:hypothetical protein